MPLSHISNDLHTPHTNLKDFIISWTFLILLNVYSWLSKMLDTILPTIPILFQLILSLLTIISSYVAVTFAIERAKLKRAERQNVELRNKLLEIELKERKE